MATDETDGTPTLKVSVGEAYRIETTGAPQDAMFLTVQIGAGEDDETLLLSALISVVKSFAKRASVADVEIKRAVNYLHSRYGS